MSDYQNNKTFAFDKNLNRVYTVVSKNNDI
jgi:hypothetical protein